MHVIAAGTGRAGGNTCVSVVVVREFDDSMTGSDLGMLTRVDELDAIC